MKTMGRSGFGFLILAGFALAGTRAMALSLVEQNVVDLLRESDAIVVGTVEKVADGIDDQGLPYTEVTLKVVGIDPRRAARDLHVPAVRAHEAASVAGR